MNEQKASAAESFVGSVFKYSISTFVNIGILGVSMLLTAWFISAEVNSQINTFISYTQTIMTIAILGLDQALIRFYLEPPAGLEPNGLFRVCFYFSSTAVLVGGVLCSTALLAPVYHAIGITMAGPWLVPALFLNALFYMVARYFNVLYRMEGNILVYTTQSILMQFFYKLFYILGNFLGLSNPVPAMMLCSLVGLGGFALVFGFMRRAVLRPRLAEFKSGAYRTVLPYGLAIAPATICVIANYAVTQSLLLHMMDKDAAGIYGYAYMLSNIVTMVQGGFASFWGPYMFANYKTGQERIKRVHNYLNLAILCFFALLVACEDIIFLIIPNYAAVQPIFPLMMLSAVFTILCETTVYGNAIARKPYFDTIGLALSFGGNIALCVALVPMMGLYGAAAALVGGNFVMFLFRTVTAQRLYKSIESPAKTALAVGLAVGLAVAGTVFSAQFWLRLAAGGAAIAIYIALYRREFVRLVNLGLGMVKGFLARGK